MPIVPESDTAPCAECGKPIMLNEQMKEARAKLKRLRPDMETGFICIACEFSLGLVKGHEA